MIVPTSRRTAKSSSKLVKATASIMVSLLLALLLVSSALAARLNEGQLSHSVDFTSYYNSGTGIPPEIRYEIQTSFPDSARWGIGQWNRLKPICIKRDILSTVTDLVYTDKPLPGSVIIATWDLKIIGPDYVRYNPILMRRQNSNNYFGVGVHETGHALGLGHPSESNENNFFRNNPIMYFRAEGLKSWLTYDRDSYNMRWGNDYNSAQRC